MSDRKENECDECGSDEYGVTFCPLHKAAPEMLAFLKEMRANGACDTPEENALVARLVALIAKADGRVD